MNGLFELLIDVLSGQADYSMIFGIMIGLTFQFLWIFTTEYNWNQKNIDSPWDKQKTFQPALLLNIVVLIDKKIIWLVKTVRRKEDSEEEAYPSISFYL